MLSRNWAEVWLGHALNALEGLYDGPEHVIGDTERPVVRSEVTECDVLSRFVRLTLFLSCAVLESEADQKFLVSGGLVSRLLVMRCKADQSTVAETRRWLWWTKWVWML
jgi:hypothetical protein